MNKVGGGGRKKVIFKRFTITTFMKYFSSFGPRSFLRFWAKYVYKFLIVAFLIKKACSKRLRDD